MPSQAQNARKARIEDAAYAVLKSAGYKSTSLLAVARRASASNETLYNWYGNKQGLFRALIEANASDARRLLQSALDESRDVLATLAALGPLLLALTTGEKAVVLNRAAAGDFSDTATLGPAIAQFGRETIAPLLRALLETAARDGTVTCRDPAEAADIYIRLLIGDLQVRRVIGAIGELSPEDIARRSEEAMALFLRLHPPASGKLPR